MSGVRDELKAKRERIAQLRKQKEERQAAARAAAASKGADSTTTGSASAPTAAPVDDLDNLLSSVDSMIGGPSKAADPTPASSSATNNASSSSSSSSAPSSSSTTVSTARGGAAGSASMAMSATVAEVSIAPRVGEMYSKEVQVALGPSGGGEGGLGGASGASGGGGGDGGDGALGGGAGDGVGQGDGGASGGPPQVEEELTPLEKEKVMSTPAFAEFLKHAAGNYFRALGEPEVPLEEMPIEERAEVEATNEFGGFLRRASRTMERALGNRFDPVVDYTGEDATDAAAAGRIAEALTHTCTFFDERWCRHRVVTDIKWSPHHPELLVVAYGAKEDTVSQDPDGIALVWSLNLVSRPEFVFQAQSAVTAVTYSSFASHFIVGATYSGQVVLWDNRSSSMPVQRTPISSAGHTHPVYGVQIVGTQNAHSLVTASTDGHLCTWSMDMLVEPQETIDLVRNPGGAAGKGGDGGAAAGGILSAQVAKDKLTEGVSTSCLAFPDGEVNTFVVGTEEGAVYECCRHGDVQGVTRRFEAHHAPVTSIDLHPAQLQQQQQAAAAQQGAEQSTAGNDGTGGGEKDGNGNDDGNNDGDDTVGGNGGASASFPGRVTDLSHLFLTSSIDWTVKLWTRDAYHAGHAARPLLTLEHFSDYVLQARWSPVHPSLVATCDASGLLEIFDIAVDTESPVASVRVGGSAGHGDKKQQQQQQQGEDAESATAAEDASGKQKRDPAAVPGESLVHQAMAKGGVVGCPAVNSLRWSQDGRRIVVGDSMGAVRVYTVADSIATPSEADWGKLEARVAEWSRGGGRAAR